MRRCRILVAVTIVATAFGCGAVAEASRPAPAEWTRPDTGDSFDEPPRFPLEMLPIHLPVIRRGARTEIVSIEVELGLTRELSPSREREVGLRLRHSIITNLVPVLEHLWVGDPADIVVPVESRVGRQALDLVGENLLERAVITRISSRPH